MATNQSNAKSFTENLSSIANSYEITSAINKLGKGIIKSDSSSASESLQSQNDKKPFSFGDEAFLDLRSEDFKEVIQENGLQDQDIKTLILEKGVAIATIVKSVSNGLISNDQASSLNSTKQGELKFFSLVMLVLKIMKQSGILDSIISFISDKITAKGWDDNNLSAKQKHSLMEEALLAKMETEVLPILDDKIPGGINTIKFITEAIASQSASKLS